jgi:hypothetical protein
MAWAIRPRHRYPRIPRGAGLGSELGNVTTKKYEEIEIQWDFKGKTCGVLMSFSIVAVMLMGRNGRNGDVHNVHMILCQLIRLLILNI